MSFFYYSSRVSLWSTNPNSSCHLENLFICHLDEAERWYIVCKMLCRGKIFL